VVSAASEREDPAFLAVWAPPFLADDQQTKDEQQETGRTEDGSEGQVEAQHGMSIAFTTVGREELPSVRDDQREKYGPEGNGGQSPRSLSQSHPATLSSRARTA
jgi:hypothetical protein